MGSRAETTMLTEIVHIVSCQLTPAPQYLFRYLPKCPVPACEEPTTTGKAAGTRVQVGGSEYYHQATKMLV